jgi:hypothetical protein
MASGTESGRFLTKTDRIHGGTMNGNMGTGLSGNAFGGRRRGLNCRRKGAGGSGAGKMMFRKSVTGCRFGRGQAQRRCLETGWRQETERRFRGSEGLPVSIVDSGFRSMIDTMKTTLNNVLDRVENLESSFRKSL